MAGKINGLGCQYWLSGYDLGDDIRDVAIASPMVPHDVTPITKFAMERIGGQRDGSMQVTVFANVDAAHAHARFSTLPSTDQLASFAVGSTLGNPVANLYGKQINYDPTRAANGELTFSAQKQANGFGLEWCTQLTAGKRTDASAVASPSSVDLGSASPGAFGLQAYLHVFSLASGTATVKIQESSDDGVGDAFADVVGGGFTAVAAAGAPTYQRIATGLINVERYLRVVTTGTFTDLVFSVSAVRNPVAVTF